MKRMATIRRVTPAYNGGDPAWSWRIDEYAWATATSQDVPLRWVAHGQVSVRHAPSELDAVKFVRHVAGDLIEVEVRS